MRRQKEQRDQADRKVITARCKSGWRERHFLTKKSRFGKPTDFAGIERRGQRRGEGAAKNFLARQARVIPVDFDHERSMFVKSLNWKNSEHPQNVMPVSFELNPTRNYRR